MAFAMARRSLIKACKTTYRSHFGLAPSLSHISATPRPGSWNNLRTFAASAQEGTNSSTAATQKLSVGPSVSKLADVPPVALGLGFAGAIPFIGLTAPFAAVLPLPEIMAGNEALWQTTYGAVILSFLGGVHWGACLSGSSPTRLLWSVTPSLLAWPACMLPASSATASLALSFLMAHAVDMTYARRGLLPPWYAALRWPLTTLATCSLLTTAYTSAQGTPEETATKK
ncbi:hypothetical protein CYMTET_54634 [Cymbomonas tetramitiformis]|uniref:DUF3429 domain-containing protein n=1 Tax=Cymbomonas tetramitiformis TaxID=36881 RepID=A0AAE0EQI8_9CHLO|nr:hypothetical protein CYMTET_54634 [Cymbomonas tetramitiformis]